MHTRGNPREPQPVTAGSPSPQPQLSPDGRWWWDGQAWVPAQSFAGPAVAAQLHGSSWNVLPGQTPYPYALPPPVRSSNDGLAIASLVLGILWLYGVGSLLAIIFGHVSRNNAAKEGREKSGMALAGLILGYLGCAGMAAMVALVVGVAATEESRQGDVEPMRRALVDAAQQEEISFIEANTYAGDPALLALSPTLGVQVEVLSATSTQYCLRATHGADSSSYDSDRGGLSTYACT
jgi:hypothetical protein